MHVHDTKFMSVLFRFVLFFLFFYFPNFYGQENVISGLENIHISEDALMVSVNPDSTITLVKNNNKQNKTLGKAVKSSLAINNISEKVSKTEKKIAKKIEKKLIKKIESKPNSVLVYNKNGKSEETFISSNITSKVGFSAPQYTIGKFINKDFCFQTFIFIYQEKQNVLYNFYKSKDVEDFLFARPPPYFLA